MLAMLDAGNGDVILRVLRCCSLGLGSVCVKVTARFPGFLGFVRYELRVTCIVLLYVYGCVGHIQHGFGRVHINHQVEKEDCLA